MKTVKMLDGEPPDMDALLQSRSYSTSTIPTIPTITAPKLSVVRRVRSQFKVSRKSEEFRRQFYPSSTIEEWNNWRWQNRNRVRTLADLQRMITLSDEESTAIARHT